MNHAVRIKNNFQFSVLNFQKIIRNLKLEIRNSWRSQVGFTLVELLVVIGIILTLFGLVTVNLVRAQHNTSVNGAVDELVSDLRSQQTKAISGTVDSSGNANSYGIYFAGTSYVLFQGTSYSAGSSSNFTVTPEATTLSTNLPSNKVVFTQRTGEIGGGPYTITVTNTYGGESKTIMINKYGVITSVIAN